MENSPDILSKYKIPDILEIAYIYDKNKLSEPDNRITCKGNIT